MKRRKMGKKHQEVKSRKVIMRRFVKVLPPYLLIAAFLLPGLAVAEEPAQKLTKGIEETATSWAEVPKEMAETTEEKNIIEGVTVGTIEGAGKAVVGTTKGVVDVATFYLPDENKEEDIDTTEKE